MPESVRSGTTVKLGTVEGDLEVGRNATIRAETGRRVVVGGEARLEGAVTIDCDFECNSMRVEGRGYGPSGDVVVHGNLRVRGTADINSSIRVEGEITSESLDVGGHMESKTVKSKSVRVGGHMKTKGRLEAETVDVGGHLSVSGEVALTNLRVGGHAEIGGGRIDGEIRVRGHFTSERKLTYGKVQAFGKLRLPAGSSGEMMSALGRVEFEGDTECKVLEVNGVVKVRGSCVTEAAEVNGKLEVAGGLRVAGKLGIYGTADVRGGIECGSLVVGGKLGAESAVVRGDAELAGDVETSRGLKANSATIKSGTGCRGPIVAQRVELGKSKFVIANLESHWAGQTIAMRGVGRMTSAEDVYGEEVVVGPNSRCERIFGKRVELGEGAIVTEVTYTDELKLPAHKYLHKPPAKVARLPEPPL